MPFELMFQNLLIETVIYISYIFRWIKMFKKLTGSNCKSLICTNNKKSVWSGQKQIQLLLLTSQTFFLMFQPNFGGSNKILLQNKYFILFFVWELNQICWSNKIFIESAKIQFGTKFQLFQQTVVNQNFCCPNRNLVGTIRRFCWLETNQTMG